MFPAMGRIRGASKLAAANPIRLPECLAIRVQIAIAIMIAINMIPNASLKARASIHSLIAVSIPYLEEPP